jgi:hypothetical protein
MPGSDDPLKKRASGTRKSSPNAVTFSEIPERETKVTEEDFMDEESLDPPRPNSSVIRRANLPVTRTNTTGTPGSPNSPVPQRRTAAQPQKPQQTQKPTSSLPNPIAIQGNSRNPAKQGLFPTKSVLQGKVHWLLPIGIGMIAMLVLWEIGTLALAWGMARYDDIRYGNPRTYQTDFAVGHGGDSRQHPSHFIAINLNRQAIVVEFPAGNPSGAQSYVVPDYILGPGGDLVPVTVEFRDVTGDGKPDMIIHMHLQSQDQTFVFVNDGTKFRAPTSKDNIHL